jgi:hypothetical protein
MAEGGEAVGGTARRERTAGGDAATEFEMESEQLCLERGCCGALTGCLATSC